ncbi:unnamed protein product [Phytophthora fragariaefolia]|uniref:Unnamed protein product n=1 Tax=Phytophthora fragariaefolia TaxID=1490495 RepID=A0A9W6Y8X9_9STRA|nr:unnamed protein product [Phytophthora fragariaefolia]
MWGDGSNEPLSNDLDFIPIVEEGNLTNGSTKPSNTVLVACPGEEHYCDTVEIGVVRSGRTSRVHADGETTLCAVRMAECSRDRVWTNCSAFMHHFCSHDVARSLDLRTVDDEIMKDFGEHCFCSRECYNVITSTTAATETQVPLSEVDEILPVSSKSFAKAQSSTAEGEEDYRPNNRKLSSTSPSPTDHIAALAKRKSVKQYARLQKNKLNLGESWSALRSVSPKMSNIPALIDEFEEMSEAGYKDWSTFRDRTELPIPLCPAEVETTKAMTFTAMDSLAEPATLFTHEDGTSKTKINEGSRKLFGHSATLSFLRSCLCHSGNKLLNSVTNMPLRDPIGRVIQFSLVK